ncbi:MAG: glucosamine kinase [Sphingobacteriales bacterium]|jgi:glucosamine kinase
MILIADSGSTKTDWRLISSKELNKHGKTDGLNPFILSEVEIVKCITSQLSMPFSDIEEVHFYGAGCSSAELCQIVNSSLKTVFNNAHIYVNHDLLGACRAVSGNEQSVVGILGTGSNACVYNGDTITQEATSLGYILGDEGSGSYFGKIIIKEFYYQLLPQEIMIEFQKHFKPNKSDMLQALYSSDKPNKFLAAFTPFIKTQIEHPHIAEMLENGFDEYIKVHILPFQIPKDTPINFVGSVAFHFHQFLKAALDKHELQLNYIVQKPIDQLVEFHKS